MGTVIGLFPSDQNLSENFKRVEEAGFTRDSMRVVTKERSIKWLLGCEPNRIVAKYASLGALIGVFVYGFFIMVAAWCDCTTYSISQIIVSEIVLAVILVGVIVGGIIGVYIGFAEYEKDTYLYTQGIDLGDKVFVLQTDAKHADEAMEILSQIGCRGVRMLP